MYGNSRNSPNTFVSNSIVRNSPCGVVRNVAVTTCTINTRGKCVCIHTRCPLSMGELEVTVRRTRGCNLLNSGVLGSNMGFRLRVGENTKTFMYKRNSTLATSVRNGENVPHMGPPHAMRGNL